MYVGILPIFSLSYERKILPSRFSVQLRCTGFTQGKPDCLDEFTIWPMRVRLSYSLEYSLIPSEPQEIFLPDTDMKNGGSRDQLGVGKLRKR